MRGDIVELFEQQAAERPGAIAVRTRATSLTYHELSTSSDGLAAVLRRSGAPDDGRGIVAILQERQLGVPGSMLAALKAGMGFLPIDPSIPDDRLRAIIVDARPHAAVCTPRQMGRAERLGLRAFSTDLLVSRVGFTGAPARLGDLAYVIYTSGSTGTPKGVMISRQNLAAFTTALPGLFGWGIGDRILAMTSISFDISILELLASVALGLEIVLADDLESSNPGALIKLAKAAAVEVIQTTPSRLRPLLWKGLLSRCARARSLLVGGEMFDGTLLNQIDLARIRTFNVYGPTETTIWSACHTVTGPDVHLGTPFPGEQILVLDEALRPAHNGAVGEICIAGVGVALGYLNRSMLTSERFVSVPFNEGLVRVYRTGDLGRRTGSRVDILGRIDHQVKLHGHRIELEEIEHTAKRHPDVEACGAFVRGDAETAQLVLCCVARAGCREGLLAHLASQLPVYMVPSRIVFLPELPMTLAGKLDRRGLECAARSAVN